MTDPSADTGEAAAEQRMRKRFAQVEAWHRTPLFEPNVGAELRADDDEWPYLATSQLVKVGLDVAAEHMYAVQQLIEARQLLPFSYRSILRTALVGATQAVWLLAPDDLATRAKRTRVLAAEMYKRHGQYLDSLLELNDLASVARHQNTQLVYENVAKRGGQLGSVRALAREVAEWNDTDAIRDAARVVFAKQPNVAQLVKEAETEWRAGSGAAHGLVWPMLGTAGTTTHGAADKHGRVVIEAQGSLLRIENSYMLAFHMTDTGWRLLRKRGI